MTVKELIAALQQMPPDALVICSSDPEGNSFSRLQEPTIQKARVDYTNRLDLLDSGEYDDEAFVCVVIWPD